MTVLDQLAHFQGQRDEAPNLALAQQVARDQNTSAVAELAANLRHELAAVQSDCIKVLYEIGQVNPSLIANHVEDFLPLLDSKSNRMVWGAMTALGSIAPLQPKRLCQAFDQIVRAFERGSVITRDHGVRVLAALSIHSKGCREKAIGVLLHHLETCRPKDLPQHAENSLEAFVAWDVDPFVQVLRRRMGELSAAQARRLKRVLAGAEESGKAV